MIHLEHSIFAFRICFVFRYSDFEFRARVESQMCPAYFCAALYDAI